eukprot:13186100-Ditylum_brightwellii.AAC.1
MQCTAYDALMLKCSACTLLVLSTSKRKKKILYPCFIEEPAVCWHAVGKCVPVAHSYHGQCN